MKEKTKEHNEKLEQKDSEAKEQKGGERKRFVLARIQAFENDPSSAPIIIHEQEQEEQADAAEKQETRIEENNKFVKIRIRALETTK